MKTVGVSFDIKFYCLCVDKFPPELVDHCAVGDVETFANLLQSFVQEYSLGLDSPEERGYYLRSVEGPVGISVQVECLPNTRNTLDEKARPEI